MPKTPPLIIPTNLPGNWMARSKINKKNKPNIFAAQNKQISFDTNDELHFLSSPSYNGYSPTIGPSPSLEQQQEELASITKHHIPSFEERVPGAIFEENNTKKHPELQYTPNHSSSQPIQSSQPQQQSSEQQQQTVEQPSSQPVPVPTNMVIDETNLQNKGRTNTEEETSRSMEQLESLSFASQDLGAEFQKYMEEYRQIKKSIEDKRKELWLYTEERMNYLDQRQAYFQKQLKILRGYI